MTDKTGVPSRIGWPAAITWLATVITPPVVAGGVWRQFVSGHVFLALAIGVAYEVAVATIGFFTVIARDVSSRWQQRLAESLDLALRLRFSGFEQRYREFLLAGLRFVDLKGLATIGPFTPELDEVFVDVSLVSRSPHQIQPGVLSELAGPGRRALSEFIGHRATVLAVVGGPGSGKTTLLRHTARQACMHAVSTRRNDRDIPILLYLRDHTVDIVGDSSVPLATLARKSLGTLLSAEPQGWFERQLRTGRCLVLLDGFDEVARQSDRAKVSDWVAHQVQQYPGNDFVISSRPQGYQAAPVMGADVVQVCGFTSVQTETFIRGWYRAIERHSTGVEGPDIEERARTEADDLLRRLEQAPALQDLTVNPLLLTMIANVHRYRGALPGNRAELYSEICQVMLWRRQDAKNLASQMHGDKKEAVLRTLAYSMMDSRVADLPHDDLVEEIKPVLRRQSRRVTAAEFLADVVSSGLLIEREPEQFAFAHHTFQEYLAAVHVREQGLASVLAEGVSDPWWRETTLLYAARSDADPIIAACLSANNLTSLGLAFACVDQDSAFDPDLHTQLDDMLNSVHESNRDPTRRRLMAGVLLTRHLGEQIRIPGGHRLCTRPITQGIYSLFRTETGQPRPDADSSSGTDEDPVRGVRGSDAIEFTKWANSITGGANTYRIPMPSSLSHQFERQEKTPLLSVPPISCAWADNSTTAGKNVFLWIPEGTKNPRAGNRDEYFSEITDDIILMIPPDIISKFGSSLILASRIIRNIALPQWEFDPDLAEAQLPSYRQGLSHIKQATKELSSTLKRDIDNPFQCDSDFAADFSLTLNTTLIRSLAQAKRKSQDLRNAPPPGISRRVFADFEKSLEEAQDMATDLALQFVRTSKSFTLADEKIIDQMPKSLTNCITSAATQAKSVEILPQALAAAVKDYANADDSAWDISIDADRLCSNLIDATNKVDQVKFWPSAQWIRLTARNLRNETERIFNRESEIANRESSLIRLSALLLAGEFNEMTRPRVRSYTDPEAPQPRSEAADMFRDVAAGITWLERRQNGTDPAAETIMLSIE